MMKFFLVIDFDGFNVGLKNNFTETYLNFESQQEATMCANHWNAWIICGDV